MVITYLVFTILTIAYNIFSAVCDFIRYKPILIAMEKAKVPHTWLFWLGILKAAGAIGLLVGFAIPSIGVAAAIGIILFYCGAIVTHLRVRDYSFGLAAFFLLLAVATLAFELINI
ncbi:hypothetical protein A8709_28870 [Paenibacillus pectinilyticus]|uniref:DoxX family protein n=1 Tax=Paenibacillus pectinilyticus TaxID=512399 RepID=A0A1C0ZUV1_9BACL|nr:DoxX family protein [Paenibacillus pectinilyticus]OCT11879.1 hypothetical protein A8709_28870 [Paenibacillus pectinilyticus]